MIKGKGVSIGVGFGNAIILKKQNREIEKKIIDNPEKELQKFKVALNEVTRETEEIVKNAEGTEKEIMSAYLMILQDETLTAETENAIKNLNYNAEYATEVGLNSIIQIFENMEDEYIAGRARDIADIKNRILKKLLNEETIDINKLPANTIIIAD